MSKIGFINLHKPAGWTSHDCVAKVRRLLKIKKVGHGGTLDPAASGVLPIAVGKATRLLSFLPEKKAYLARIRLGIQTTTDDLEGEVIQTQSASDLTLTKIEPYRQQFLGKIQQIPPAYSAIKQQGKPLYELARTGEKVEPPVRTVEVYQFDILGWYPAPFPELEIAIVCGPGTYIRGIARDLGVALNVGGTLAALERTESCGMKLTESLTIEEIATQLKQGTFSLIRPEIALQHLGEITLTVAEGKRWCQGQSLPISQQGKTSNGDRTTNDSPFIVRVADENKQFLGIGKLVKSDSLELLIPNIVVG